MELTFPAQLEARMCPLARTAVKRPVLQKTAVSSVAPAPRARTARPPPSLPLAQTTRSAPPLGSIWIKDTNEE